MNRLIVTISVIALLCAGCGGSKASTDGSKSLSRAEAESYSKDLTAKWIADSKVAMASVFNSKVAKDGELEMPLWWTT